MCRWTPVKTRARSFGRAWGALLVAVVGCGRLGFEAQHDGGEAGSELCLDDRVDLNGNSVADCVETTVTNNQFPTDTLPWIDSARATVSWLSADARGLATSGSAQVINIVPTTTANGGDVTGECLVVQPSQKYGAYVNYWMASGQPGGDASAATWIVVVTYRDTACTLPSSTISGGILGSTKNAWAVYSRQITTSVADHSLRLKLGVLKGPTTSMVSARFDNVLFLAE